MHLGKKVKAAITADSRLLPAAAVPASINSLRILLVDDNQINLSVLSTLLKRRFGHILAASPVTLDSGLKALRLLRTEVFDLVFMDIEMPYLDGVECSRRIRSGEDGVLEANSNAHIIAVTTNIGDEPEALYRAVGMDGMIGKPVRFDHFQQYLCPLAVQAQEARSSIAPIWVGDRNVLPPLPPVGTRNRVFFKPVLAPGTPTSKISRLDSQESFEDDSFANMLRAQTRASLRDRRTMFLARTGTLSEPRRTSFDDRQEQLARQSIREIASSNDRNEATFQALIDQEAMMTPEPSSLGGDRQDHGNGHVYGGRSASFTRPCVSHRFSSPTYLLDASPAAKLKTDPAARSTPNLVRSTYSLRRPGIRPLIGAISQSHSRRSETPNSFDASGCDGSAGGSSFFSDLTQLRRPSDDDTSSSSLTTPQSSPMSGASFLSTSSSCGDFKAGAVFSPCEDDLHSVFLRVSISDVQQVKLPRDGSFLDNGKHHVVVAATAAATQAGKVDASDLPYSMIGSQSPARATCASW